ncbi:transglycosylase domain-containing protein [Cytobacillus dafuensis]|uniref:PBP1A family penicillin-binding protein n=1 Tax=Cytobacillus dafuensis TaxID=1742359 RepID=A0A5B8Z3F8_CYTDA|nr:PBP1A family penicillin-binding protein [Cytobacillus dafuensis]QED46813.1 PBP1A family penicillin-binding protein [Cytobacillus dafuensis]
MINRRNQLILCCFFILLVLTSCSPTEYVNDVKVDLSKLDVYSNTVIYDKNGEKIQELHNKEHPEVVFLKDLPEYLKMAFVVTEDKRFFEHKGVDPKGILRALYKNIESGSRTEGASTITQQLARNVYLSNEKTIERKTKEMVIAAEIERKYTKEQILEMYLNHIYFGSGAYGIQAAAQEYFGKDAKDLNIAESALLAGLPKAPSKYSPRSNMDLAKERRATVLSLMRKNNIITEVEEKEANKEEIKLPPKTTQEYSAYQSYIDYALKEATSEYGVTLEDLYRGGYKIYTNLDTSIHQAMNQAVENYRFTEDEPDQQVEVGMTAIDPNSGAILAMYGGRNYVYQDFNHATAKYQPGSTIKPLAVYAPALETNEWEPDSLLKDEPMNFGNYSPENAEHRYYGDVSMEEAVGRSLNVPAVYLLQQIGINKGYDFVENAGIELDPNDRNLSLALGGLTYGASTLDMAQAYSAFANGGKITKAHAIKEIVDSHGKVLPSPAIETKIIMSEETASEMTKMLQGVISKPYGTGRLADIGTPLAGKTGTTEANLEGINGNKDAWFVGYTPNLVLSIHSGFDKTDRNHYLTGGGGKTPAELFKYVMMYGI